MDFILREMALLGYLWRGHRVPSFVTADVVGVPAQPGPVCLLQFCVVASVLFSPRNCWRNSHMFA